MPARSIPGRDRLEQGQRGRAKSRVAPGSLFDDRWTLVGGYRNAKGELDQLLVGPNGLMAIEIKFINGRVSCDGDRWWRDKYDRYGNLVERALPIVDLAPRPRNARPAVNRSA